MSAWSGPPESNRRFQHGALKHYHYVRPAWCASPESNRERPVCKAGALPRGPLAHGVVAGDRTRDLRFIGAVLSATELRQHGTPSGNRTRVTDVKNRLPTISGSELAHTMGADPTTFGSTIRRSAVELRVHGGRWTNRTPSAHHAPTVFETAWRPLSSTFRGLGARGPDSNRLLRLYGSRARPNELHGHGDDATSSWLRGLGSNQRISGFRDRRLTVLATPHRIFSNVIRRICGASGRSRADLSSA
jgi:hypothetical protein